MAADTAPLDVKIDLKKPTKRGNAIIVRGDLSCIDLNLTYTSFILLKAIMKDNLSRKIDVRTHTQCRSAHVEQRSISFRHAFVQSSAAGWVSCR